MNEPKQTLDLRQTQQLVMTPQLQQAIKMLQLNNQELDYYIEEELARNPLLERDESVPEDAQDTGSDAPDTQAQAGEAAPDSDTMESAFDAGTSAAELGAGGNHAFEEQDWSLENSLSSNQSLRDVLIEQLYTDFEDARDRMIGTLMIDHLDEAGYLRVERDELAERLNCSRERIDNLLTRMKRYEPAGVFAADLSECLALQLEEAGELDAPMRVMLDNLDRLADHDVTGLARKCGVKPDDVQNMIARIRRLNPRPASDYEHFVAQTVVPDVLMKRRPKHLGGGWRVELNSDTLPRVLVNNEYYTEVAQQAASKEDKNYLNQHLTAANWIVRALDQRARTITAVAGEIVEQQDGFFNYGIEFLQPLTLREVAEACELHESTVSRVTTNKYIGTPRGIFELKFFFTSALSGSGGTEHSAEAVRAKIKGLIDQERPDNILSDDAIVAALKNEGIDIARRTVAKYRDAMHIPPSSQRRRQKKNAGA